MNLSAYTITLKSQLAEAVKQILNSNERTIFVLDSEKKLIGVISEGDVLRAINNGVLTTTHVINFMNPAPFFSYKLLDEREFIQIYIDKGFQLIPIIDTDGNLIKIQSLREILESYRTI
jgi:predicted transcriptional regulator